MLDRITAVLESDSVEIACIFIGIFIVTIIVLKRRKKNFLSIPTKTTTGYLVKTSDYVGDASAEFAEHRQSYSVGKYQYEINGKKYTKQIKTGYGGALKDQITLYYKKGHKDINLDSNVQPSQGSALLLVLYFAILCPVLATAIWMLVKSVIGSV